MNTRDFCIWFKGFLDVTRSAQLEVVQLDIIKKNLEETLIQERIVEQKADKESLKRDSYGQINVPGSFGWGAQ